MTANELFGTACGTKDPTPARGEETFDSDYGKSLIEKWGVPDDMICRCFILLGYVDGEMPRAKPRRQGRYKIVIS